MRKGIWIVILLVLAAVGGAAYWAWTELDVMARDVVEEAGSAALGVPVYVRKVDIQLLDRQATLRGVRVSNPPGYSRKAAISFDSITLQMGDSTNHIKRIVAVEPRLRVEIKGSASNLGQLQAKVRRAAGHSGGASRRMPGSDQVFSVGMLRVVDAKAILTGPNIKQPIKLEVSDIQLRNLRGTAAQIAGQVFSGLMGITMDKAASVAAQRGLGKIMNQQGDYGNKVSDILNRLGGGRQ